MSLVLVKYNVVLLLLLLVVNTLAANTPNVLHSEPVQDESEEEEEGCAKSTCDELKKQIKLLNSRLTQLEAQFQLHKTFGGNAAGGKTDGGSCAGVGGGEHGYHTIYELQKFPAPELSRAFFQAPIRELLLGAGANSRKKIATRGRSEWGHMVSVDSNTDTKPTIFWDLMDLPLPFPDESFDEIHAYEVLEHTGQQGDFRFFFKQFAEIYRLLKPDGLFVATVPNGNWIWGDPSHTRYIGQESLIFLNQAEATRQVGNTPMSDFRHWFKDDFVLLWEKKDDVYAFVLMAIKPSRLGNTIAQNAVILEKLRAKALGEVQRLNKLFNTPAAAPKKA